MTNQPGEEVPNLKFTEMRIGAAEVEVTPTEFNQKIHGTREWVRTALAGGAFLTLVVVLVLLLISVWEDINMDTFWKKSALS